MGCLVQVVTSSGAAGGYHRCADKRASNKNSLHQTLQMAYFIRSCANPQPHWILMAATLTGKLEALPINNTELH